MGEHGLHSVSGGPMKTIWPGDTSIALQELAGLKRGKEQMAKELVDSVRRLASLAYYTTDPGRVPGSGQRGTSARVK